MTVHVYGKPDCADYARVRDGFAAAGIAFTFHDVLAEPEAAATAVRISGVERTPVVELADGSFVVEPDDPQIDELLRLIGIGVRAGHARSDS